MLVFLAGISFDFFISERVFVPPKVAVEYLIYRPDCQNEEDDAEAILWVVQNKLEHEMQLRVLLLTKSIEDCQIGG